MTHFRVAVSPATPATATTPTSTRTLATDDLAAVIGHFGLHEATLVAHSLGSKEAVRYLTRHGEDRIARLVLIGAVTRLLRRTTDNPGGLDPALIDANYAAVAADVPKWCADFEAAGPYFGSSPGGSPGLIDWTIRPSFAVFAAVTFILVTPGPGVLNVVAQCTNFHHDTVTTIFLREHGVVGLTRLRTRLHTLVWLQSLSLLDSSMSSALSPRDDATPIGPVGQIGILVTDIVAASAQYQRIFGVTEWRRYTYGPGFVPDLWYRGRAAGFSMHIALGGTGPQLELIEPLAAPSIYHEHIRAHGYGVHHLGVFVASLDEAITTMTAHGYELIQYGRGYGLDGDGGFAYFDTSHDHHTTIEAIEVPRRRRTPLVSWARPHNTGGNTST